MGIKYDGLKLVWIKQNASDDTFLTWLSPDEGSLGSFLGGSTVYLPVKVRVVSGPAPTFSITSGTIPDGLSFNNQTGALSGVLDNVAQSYAFTITCTSNTASVSREFSLDVTQNSAPVWTTPAGTLGTQRDGTFANVVVVATDPEGEPVTYSVAAGSLPDGLTLNTDTGVISGILSGVGGDTTFFFTIAASDGILSLNRAFSFTVDYNAPPTWQTPAGLLGHAVEYATANYAVVATDADNGDVVSYSLVSGSLPVGMSLNSNTGWINGVVSQVGYSQERRFTLRASDGLRGLNRDFSIAVDKNLPAVWISQGTIVTDLGGNYINTQLQAYDPNGLPLTFSLTSGTLPDGVTLTSAGAIYGFLPQVEESTDYTFTIDAFDGVNPSPRTLKIRAVLNTPPVWNTLNLSNAISSVPYTFTLSAVDPEAFSDISYALNASTLPSGLSLNGATGVISGTPANYGSDFTFDLTIDASDGVLTTPRDFSLIVKENLDPIWNTASGLIANALAKTAISVQLEGYDPNGLPVSYSLESGTLPAGITLSAAGRISGTLPAVVSDTESEFTVNLFDGYNTVARTFSIINRVNAAPVWLTAAGSIGGGFEQTPFSYQLQGYDPDGYAVSYRLKYPGSLPFGLYLSGTGRISGTLPTVLQDAHPSFDVVLSDGSLDNYNEVERNFTIDVMFNSAPVWITGSNLGNIIENAAYSNQLSATGVGNGPMVYTLKSGALPAGWTLTKAGMLSGVSPAVASDTVFNFTINAFNGIKGADQSFTLTVQHNVPPVWVSNAGTIGSFYGNNTFEVQLVASDANGTPLTYTLVNSTTLPAGVTMSTSGRIAGKLAIVANATTYNFEVGASDGQSRVDRAFSVTAYSNQLPNWVTPSGSIFTGQKNKPVNTGVVATDLENSALTYALAVGSTLPTGLSLNSSTGRITGLAPNVSSNTNYPFTMTVTDGSAAPVEREFSIDVNVDTVPIWDTPAGTLGNTLSGYTFNFNFSAHDPEGLPVSYTMTSGTLPPNSTFNTSGAVHTVDINGTPVSDTDQTYTFTVTASDGTLTGPERTFSITVLKNLLPVWTTPAGSLGTQPEGSAFSATVHANDPEGLTITYTVTGGALPANVSLNNNTGQISGTLPPIATDTTYNFTITASDSRRSVPRSFSLVSTFNSPPAWTTASALGNELESSPYSKTLVATSNGDQVTYTSNNLPAFLTLNANGALTGMLPSVGSDTPYSFLATAHNPQGKTTDRTFTFSVINNIPPVWTTDAGLITALAGTTFNFPLVATDPNGTPLTYEHVSGTVPPGVTLDVGNSAAIYGTLPAVTEDTTYTIRVGASDGFTRVDRDFTLTSKLDTPAVWITNAGVILTQIEASYANTSVLAVDPNGNTVTYALDNGTSLPGALTLYSNGAIRGTLPAYSNGSSYNFDIAASDGHFSTGRTFTIALTQNQAPVWITNTVLADANESSQYSVTLLATDPDGDAVTYTMVNSPALPGTITLYSNGAVRGLAPSTNNDLGAEFTARATDVWGKWSEKTFNFTVKNDTSYLDQNSDKVTYLNHFDSMPDSEWANVVVFLPFNGDTINYAGYTNSGVGTVGTTAPKYGSGCLIAAENSSTAVVALPSSLDNKPFTIEFWLKRDRLGVNREGIVAVGGQGLPNTISMEFLTNNTIRILENTVGILVSNAAISDITDWHHVAMCSNGTAVTLFVDGVSQGAPANYYDGTLTSATTFVAGGTGLSNFNFLGKFDDIRMTVGTSRYSSNFTPSQNQMPLQDYYGTYTQQIGAVNTSSAVSKFGAASARMSNATAMVIPAAATGTNQNTTSGSFTVEGWFYLTAYPTAAESYNYLFYKTASVGEYFSARVSNATSKVEFFTYNGTSAVSIGNSAAAVPLNTWFNVSYSVSNSTVQTYVNGTRVSNAAITRATSTAGLNIGGTGASPRWTFRGYTDDVRLTDVARYSGASYVVPEFPYGNAPLWNTPAGALATTTEESTANVVVSATDPYNLGYALYEVTSGALPSTLTLNANTGAITGTLPYAAGPTGYAFGIQKTEGNGNKSSTRTFSVIPSVFPTPALALSWRLNRATGVTYTNLAPDVGTAAVTTYATGPTMVAAPGYSGDTAAYYNQTVTKMTTDTSSIRALVGDFTYEVWLNPLASPGATNTRFVFGIGSTAKFFVYYDPADNQWKNVYNNVTNSFGTLSLNTWHHLAVVKINSTIYLYADGVNVASSAVTTPALTYFDSDTMTIGNYNNGNAGTINNISNLLIRSMNIWSTVKYNTNFTPSWNSFVQPYWNSKSTTVYVANNAPIQVAYTAASFGNTTVSYGLANATTSGIGIDSTGALTGNAPATVGNASTVSFMATDSKSRTAPIRDITVIAETADPFYSNVVLLYQDDLVDATGKTITLFTATRSTSTYKYGTASLSFNGQVGTIARTTPSPRFSFGSNDWTFEAWVYTPGLTNTSNAGYSGCLWNLTDGSTVNTYNAMGFYLSGTATGVSGLGFQARDQSNSGAAMLNTAATFSEATFPLNTWHHVAFVRSGANMLHFLNGVNVGTTTNAFTGPTASMYFPPNGFIQFGGINVTSWTSPYNGFMDDARITNGNARYTTNFTPPGRLGGIIKNPIFTNTPSANTAVGYANSVIQKTIAATSVDTSAAITYTIASSTPPGVATINSTTGTMAVTFANTTAATANVTVRALADVFYTDRVINFQAVDSEILDTYYANVVAMMPMYGTVGTVPAELTGKSVTTTGTPVLSATQSKWGTQSFQTLANNYAFVTNTGGVLSSPGNFTVEGWFYKTAYATAYDAFFGSYTTTTANDTLMYTNLAGQLRFYVPTTDYIIGGGAGVTFPLNQWVHLAWSRVAGTSYFFMNGNLIGTSQVYVGTFCPSTQRLTVGGYEGQAASAGHVGFTNDFRYTKGVGRYTANFTPPTQPLPNKPNTAPQILLNNTTAYSNAVLNYSATFNANSFTLANEPTGLIANGSLLTGKMPFLSNTTVYNTTVSATNASSTSNAVVTYNVVVDPYLANTIVQMPMIGNPGAQLTERSSGKAITIQGGGGVLTQLVSKWGNQTTAGFSFGNFSYVGGIPQMTGAYTIEAWIHQIQPASAAPPNGLYSFYLSNNPNGSGPGYFIGVNASQQLVLRESAVDRIVGPVIPLNTWTHIALTRSGTLSTLWVNGVAVGSTNGTVSDWGQTSARIGLGGYEQVPANYGYNGAITDLRITNGVSRYSGTFTPPTQQFTLLPNDDPQYASVSVLVNGEGTLTDSTGNCTFTANGASISTVKKQFGNSSVSFPGTVTQTITQSQTNPTAGLDFGTGDFTMETWFNITALTAAGGGDYRSQLLHYSPPAATNVSTASVWSLHVGGPTASAGTAISFYSGSGSTFTFSPSASIPVNTWHHIAIVRQSGVFRCYLNGNLVGSQTSSFSFPSGTGSALLLGGNPVASYTANLNGYLDDIRITKGVARYVTPFTPPGQLGNF
jgi:hypothetical protein